MKFGNNGFIVARDTENEARETLREIIDKADREAVDGFRTGLVGTPEQVAERILELKRAGADLILGGFLHHLEDAEYFGRRVLPLVRELEAQQLESVG